MDKLNRAEKWWAAREPWLRSQGYGLRSRLRPGWVASWKGNPNRGAFDSEDGPISFHATKAIDAVRLSDGLHVYLKPIVKGSDEQAILKYLMAPSIVETSRRHVAQVLETLDGIPGDDKRVFIVMPRLQKIHIPWFETIGECLDCIKQMFEAVQFLHRHKIAHRDCHIENILMEGDKIFPHGFHPVMTEMNLEYTAEACHLTRTQRPPRYLFIDFGISIKYSLDEHHPTATRKFGGDKSAPELHKIDSVTPYNPFPTDVYYVANTARGVFMKEGWDVIHGYHELEFLRPLIKDMTQEDPLLRPNIDQAIERLDAIIEKLGTWRLRNPVTNTDANAWIHFLRFFPYLVRRIGYTIRGVHPIPSRNINMT